MGPPCKEIAATDDDPLYQTERWFLVRPGLRSGYRIPVPYGRYRVVLHFAEIWYRDPGKQRFEVLLEGRKVLEGYDPKVASAEKFTFEEKVEDGQLDLDFVRGANWVDNPKISAIEVELLR